MYQPIPTYLVTFHQGCSRGRSKGAHTPGVTFKKGVKIKKLKKKKNRFKRKYGKSLIGKKKQEAQVK